MATATDTVTTAQQQLIEMVRTGQDAVVGALGVWGETFQGLVPDLPSPLTDVLPSPEAVVESTFGFGEKLLAAQREFTVNAWNALVPKAGRNASSLEV